MKTATWWTEGRATVKVMMTVDEDKNRVAFAEYRNQAKRMKRKSKVIRTVIDYGKEPHTRLNRNQS